MIKNLNQPQLKTVQRILNNIKNMSDAELKIKRNNISASDGNLEMKEVILEGIDSKLNRVQLSRIAIVCDGDLRMGEV